MSDPAAVVLSFVYVAAVLGVAEFIRNRLDLKKDFTRKFVHVFVGTYIVPTFYLFDSLYYALIPPVAFLVVNVLSYKFKVFKAMEEEDGKNLGTMLFPVSFIIVMIIFWDAGHPYRAAAMMGILVMAWGDAAASIVGRNFGKHHYFFFRERKSVEGSIAMFFASYIGLIMVLAMWGNPWMGFSQKVIAAVTVAIFGTFLEAISIRGTDNLIVPVLSSGAAWVVLKLFSPY